MSPVVSAQTADNPDAQFALGSAYKHGEDGRTADLSLAESWFGKAAAQGHARAGDEYGLILFQNGKEREALPWLEKGAARGEPRAQYLLGTILFNGALAERDWPRAYALMLRSTAAGLEQAGHTLSQMDQFIPIEQRREGAALARGMDSLAQRDATASVDELPGASYAAPASAMSTPALEPVPPARMPEEPRAAVAMAPPEPQPLPPSPPIAPVSSAGAWRVQLGAFVDAARAPALWSQLRARGAFTEAHEPYYLKSGRFTRLLVGPYASATEAGRACTRLKAAGHAACLPIVP